MGFLALFEKVVDKVFYLMQIPMQFGAFSVTLWQVFAFTFLAPLAFYFIGFLLGLIKSN